MKSNWIWAEIAALAIVAGVGTEAGAEQQSAKITIRVVNSAKVAAGTLAEGEKRAGWVLGQAGVRVVWLDCTAPGSCAEDPGMNEFWLHVANWKPAGASEQELGFTTFDKETASGIGVAGVCYPMVRQVAAQIEMEEGLILAAAMAHEIGHVLGAGHSSSGIMQAKFNRQSIVSMSQGGYVFARKQAGGIRADAVWRNAGAGAAVVSPLR